MNKFLGIDNYHIRLTIDNTLEHVKTVINKIGVKWIISHEVTHFHCLVQTQKKKKDITDIIKKELEIKGNEKFSVVPVRKLSQMKKYILKDGFYEYQGYDEKEIEILMLCSNKKGMDKISTEIQELEEEFMSGNILFLRFCEKYVKIKIDYGQNIYGNHIKAYCYKMRMKKSPDFIRSYVSNLMQD